MNANNLTNNAELDGDGLVAAMNRVRNSSEQQVVRLHEQAQRLVDWREYVRSRPYVAVGVALLGGFWLMHRRCPKCPQQQKAGRIKVEESDSKVARTSLASGAMAFVGSMASQAIKYYAMNQLRQRMGFNHDQPIGSRYESAGVGGAAASSSTSSASSSRNTGWNQNGTRR